ncbi:phosphoglycerate dehydrogenase [Oceanibacterium hippocampi]|uniref:D-3-phosphoglycerate dehydrogenase n=1 Tax=Oceanibacterium hippocampi TaxID=745714 RepID=A0A1Y5TUG3_9PROT|nr:phosphoglycerate dehydrogenase [Oceanibacterium hippocampi]SLN73115.1 D-3-phosphoglycerate dehydrogenase [Oceanibacterium hippocampi]
MVKVLISDKMSPNAARIFRARGIEVDEKPGMSKEELLACIGEYDGLAIRSATKVSDKVLKAAKNLKVVGRAGIGVDNVDVTAATEAGVCVMNTPFGNAITTAEHAIALLFSLARQIPTANASTHAGKWEKSRFMGVELYGKTLGIVGCGNIGSIVAERALGLSMKVVAYDPFLSAERAADLGVERVELDDLLARADFISFHTPLTDQTRGMLNKESIAKTKKGVRIVNCARGGLIVEADLKAALESGHVAGAAMDVFAEEPAENNILFGMENVVATPHLGASTLEAQENVAIQVAEQMSDFLLLGAVTNALNMASVTAEEAPRLKPYMALAQQLGSFAGQVTEHVLKKVLIEYQGHVAMLNTKPLTAVMLQGLLKPLLDSVNMVNAVVVAQQRNIDLTIATNERADPYQTAIRLTVTTEKRQRSVTGTLFADHHPRVVEINGIGIEAVLRPHMLLITNDDKPGLIGALGTTLAKGGVNIATFNLGRAAPGGDALALLEIDETLSDEVMKTVSGLDHVKQVKPLAFPG